MYLAGSALAAFFFILERCILAPLLVEQSAPNTTTDSTIANNGDTAGAQDGEQWKEFARGMEGMYVVFVPFAPCLIWSLVVRYFWIKETKILEEEKKKK